MKKIVIEEESGEQIILLDNDDADITEYCHKLSKSMIGNNINIIETSQVSLIIRPYKIISIKVFNMSSDINLNDEDVVSDLDKKENIVHKIDIITDMNEENAVTEKDSENVEPNDS